jgi:hypothetical protein
MPLLPLGLAAACGAGIILVVSGSNAMSIAGPALILLGLAFASLLGSHRSRALQATSPTTTTSRDGTHAAAVRRRHRRCGARPPRGSGSWLPSP